MKEVKLILVGGGGHCRSVLDVLVATNAVQILHIADVQEKVGGMVLPPYTIDGTLEDIQNWLKETVYYHIGIGQIKSSLPREEHATILNAAGGVPYTIISPFARVSPDAQIEEGSFVGHQVVINAQARIGKHCIINTGAIIEHNAIIGEFCHVSTGAIVNGDCVIGSSSFVGSGAVISNGVHIGRNCIIGAGAVVINNIPDGSTVVGNPGRIVKG